MPTQVGTLEDALKRALGELTFGNVVLSHQLQELAKKLEDAQGAKPKTVPAETNGGR